MNTRLFTVPEDVDGQIVHPLDVWNLVEWGGKFYACEIKLILVGSVL